MQFDQLIPRAITLPDGATINFVRGGRGPTLIFIHGVMGDYRSWEPQWHAFTSKYDCIALSCRFNFPNNNTMEAPNHSAIENADDIACFMDILNIESAIIIGSSYGGFSSLALAVHHPIRVRALIAIEPPMMKYAEMFTDTADVASQFRKTTVAPSREAFERGNDDLGAILLTGGIQNASIGSIPPEQLQQRRENIMAGRRVALSSDEFPLLAPEKLAAIKVPMMIFTGANTGPIFKAMMLGISRIIPEVPMVVVENAGHSVPKDQPGFFNRVAIEFLTKNL